MQQTKLICRVPFEAVEVTPGGDVKVCCWADHYIIGNIENHNITSIWNGDKAIAFRNSMYDGSYRFCDKNKCPYLKESHPRHGKMLIDAQKPTDELRTLMPWEVAEAIKKQERQLSYSPKSITLSYDRTCNLTCPSCRPKFYNENARKKQFENFYRNLYPYGEHLVLSGAGDPFASAHFLEILFNSQEHDLKSVKRITLITNGVLLTENLWKRVSPVIKSRFIELSISVDAANEETFLVNRQGGNWKKLLENLDFIKHCDDFKTLEMSFVIHENNFR